METAPIMLVTERLSSNNIIIRHIFHIDECLHFRDLPHLRCGQAQLLERATESIRSIRAWHLGVRIFVVMVDVLLSGLGSGVVDVTDAVFVIVPCACGLMVPRMIIVRDAPAAMVPRFRLPVHG